MKLTDFFEKNKRVAIAFSGGVDSSYLLYTALQCGAEVCAYYVKTIFQPQFELNDAMRLAKELNVDMRVIQLDVLSDSKVGLNPWDRCYYCKRKIFSAIAKAAFKDGFTTLLDGTNASDDADDRPGMKALTELSVKSPLRQCGLTKSDIRRFSREAGLFTWNKPAYACLATRISKGERITREKIERTEKAEDYLASLGFTDFRVRMFGNAAKIQIPSSQLQLIVEKRKEIIKELQRYYDAVLLDLEVRDE